MSLGRRSHRRQDDILKDVLSRYDRQLGCESGPSRGRKVHHTRKFKPPPSESESTISMIAYDNKSSRKSRAWSSMVHAIKPELRDAVHASCGGDKAAMRVIDSSHKWNDVIQELESNAKARDDFLLLLQMMEDRGAAVNSAAMRRIALDVGCHHLRRLLRVSGIRSHSASDSTGTCSPPMDLVIGSPAPVLHVPEILGYPGPDVYTGLKTGIDRIQDANMHLNLQNMHTAAKKSEAERTLFAEMMKRNDDLKHVSEDVKIERMRLAKENTDLKQQVDQLQYDLKIANELTDHQSKKSRETEEATKRELESLDGGIKELEEKLCTVSKKNAILSEEKECFKAHNEALLKEVERQDKVIRKLGRSVDSYSAISADFTNIVEPMFKLVRGLKERLDEYDVMRERLVNNIRDIRDDKEYAYRVGDLVVEMTTSRLWRIMEQYTDNNGRLHTHIEELQDMTRHMDKAMETLKEDVNKGDRY